MRKKQKEKQIRRKHLQIMWSTRDSVSQFSRQSCPTLCCPMDCSRPGFPLHHQLPEIVHQVGDVNQPSHPLLSLSPPTPIFPSILVFSSESVLCIGWPKYWSFSFSIRPSKEYSGLVSFRMDWLDLLAFHGTLKSLLQHHSSKSINSSVFNLLYSATFTSIHTTGKTIALTRWTFVSKVISLLYNMLSRLAIGSPELQLDSLPTELSGKPSQGTSMF